MRGRDEGGELAHGCLELGDPLFEGGGSGQRGLHGSHRHLWHSGLGIFGDIDLLGSQISGDGLGDFYFDFFPAGVS